MSIYEIVILVLSVFLLVLFSGLNMTVQTLKTQISNNTTTIQALSGELTTLKSEINPVKLSKPFMQYSILFENAPRTLPSFPLNTVTATNLEDFIPILSVNDFYEITQMNKQYFLAYPAAGGSTFSIQILSSPYSDRVLKIVNLLRGQNIPAFDIQYGSQFSLFAGVFPNYVAATQYASAISSAIFPTVGSTLSSWLIRQIP
ncbi:hypothetical protein [Athalassotoga sp.]|uniref:hypothetical protein n=1 Tax=Athalassotoga sp. TaxID=2022597 RepID=UPI003CFDB715